MTTEKNDEYVYKKYTPETKINNFTPVISWSLSVNKIRTSTCGKFTIEETFHGLFILVDTTIGRNIVCDTLEEAQNQAEFII